MARHQTENEGLFFRSVGELVLCNAMLDQKIGQVLCILFAIEDKPMSLPLMTALDTSRKVEMLKSQASIITAPEWSRAIDRLVSKCETVNRWRNVVCHSVLNFEDGAPVLRSLSAINMLKGMAKAKPLDTYKAKKVSLGDIKSAIHEAEVAFKLVEELLQNLEQLRQARSKVVF